MNSTVPLYQPSLTLLTDLYQLTMAYGYWKAKVDHKGAVFNLFFRKNPFEGGYAIACGLATAIDFLNRFRFQEEDLVYLLQLQGNDGSPLFEKAFLDYLRDLQFSCDVFAMPEGTVAFPHEPLMRVHGPIVQAQLLETPLLNIINFPTLIATKAARVCHAAKGMSLDSYEPYGPVRPGPVLEFGLRRAQGIDGGLSASRAAFIGGCHATSNVLAGKLFGIPVRGTHAHSWVMAFDDEMEAFRAYAKAMPNNCVFLVDTYDTLKGVRKAVEIGKWLRSQGHEMVGIRLDSGDLADLSIKARKLLDDAGFPKAAIIGSNELDEHAITDLLEHGAKISIWGVGTRLATGHDDPALTGVYKLTAVREPGKSKTLSDLSRAQAREAEGQWEYKMKISEQAAKTSNPGIQQVRRFSSSSEFLIDAIYDEEMGIAVDSTGSPQANCVIVDLEHPSKRTQMPATTTYEDLLVPVFRSGRQVYNPPTIEQSRERAQQQLAHLPSGVKRLKSPDTYPVGLEERLHQLKTQLVTKATNEAVRKETDEA